MNRTIVILHGWGLSSEKYAGLAALLRREHFRVFVPDFPSDRVQTLSDFVTFLDSFLTKNTIHSPILLCHSFGGRVALKYIYEHPRDVVGLILSGTPGFTPVAKRKLVMVTALAKIGKYILPFEFVRRWYYYVAGARDYFRATPAMRQTYKNVVTESLVPYMQSVRIPTMLVWGEHDIITPPWIAKKMQSVISHAQLVIIPDADHGVSYKKPKAFVHALYDFLFSLS